MMRTIVKLALACAVSAELSAEWEADQLALLQLRASQKAEEVVEGEEIVDEELKPQNACKSGIKVKGFCYAASCGRTGQRPGGRNCGSLPGGANACCKSRLKRTCTGPNMDRCKIPKAMGMGKMGNMGKMGMGKMGMGKMGMGMGDEAEAVGDPHLAMADGEKSDLCCDGGVCEPCPPAMLQEDGEEETDLKPKNACKSGIRRKNICYAASCGRNGQQPGGRNCGALPGGANACCRSRITRPCTGPNMDRCRVPKRMGMGMGKMGMGMGKMGMGMGKMGMGKMGMGIDDEAEAVGDPHLTLSNGDHADLCCEGGVCKACEQ